MIVEGHAGSGARGSGDRNRRARGLPRAHDQLLGSAVHLAHRRHEADPLVFGARPVESDRSEARLHGHPAPLVYPRLVTVITQSSRRARTLDAYVPPTRVDLRVVGRGRAQFYSRLGARTTVSGRYDSAVVPSSDRYLPSSRITVSGPSVGRIDHVVIAQYDRTTRTVVTVRPEGDVPVVGLEVPAGGCLHLARCLD